MAKKDKKRKEEKGKERKTRPFSIEISGYATGPPPTETFAAITSVASSHRKQELRSSLLNFSLTENCFMSNNFVQKYFCFKK